MAPIQRMQIDSLAQVQQALQNLPADLRDKLQSPGEQEVQPLTPLDLFDDDNIFTPGGSYSPDGEKINNLRARIFLLWSDLLLENETKWPLIKLLGHGSYNIIVGVDVVPESERGDGSKPSAEILELFGTPPKPRTLSLRVQVAAHFDFVGLLEGASNGEIYKYIVNLYVVGSCLDLPIPTILRYELTSSNPLGRPFTLQSYLVGKDLQRIWGELNLKQKVSAIKAITQIVAKITSVTAPAAGCIAYSNVTSPGKVIKLDEFHFPTMVHTPKSELPDPCEAVEQTPCEFLKSRCNRWIRQEQETMPSLSITAPLWNKIMEIILVLEKKGWLGDRFHLIHGDLFPRNVLVEVVSDTAVKVTGVIDWDMACFLSKFVAFRGPFWAWNAPGFDESNEDRANTGNLCQEKQAMKQAFLDMASPEYATMALAEEAIIARKICKVATEGLLTVEKRDVAYKLIKQWDEFHPQLTKQYVAL